MRKVQVLMGAFVVNILLNITAALFPRAVSIELSRWGWVLVLLYLTHVIASSREGKKAAIRLRSIFGGYVVLSYVIVALAYAIVGVIGWKSINVAFARLSDGGSVESAGSEGTSTGEPRAALHESSKRPQQDALHIAIEFSIGGGSRGKPGQFDPTTISGFWIMFHNGASASPANMAMFVRMTNTQETPITIESVIYEALGLNTGQWHQLKRLPLISHRSCYGFDTLQKARIVDFSTNSLAVHIADKAIGSGMSVRGWELLEYPDNFQFSGLPLRCKVKDILGNEYTAIAKLPEKDAANSNTMTRSIEFGPWIDLSKARRDYWSNIVAH